MKRIIDGKTYNTETATMIAEWSNDLGAGDFGHCEEELYRTDKSTFFLSGSGGPMTRWSRSAGGGSIGGSGIRVLSGAEALAWCEGHGVGADIIEEWFEIEEG